MLVIALAACGEPLPRTSLIANPAAASGELREACRLTEVKCTRCHTLGRILAFEASTREAWEPIVTRMRMMMSSGITKRDAERVLDCLSDGRTQHVFRAYAPPSTTNR